MSKLRALDALQIEVRQAGIVQDSVIVSLQDARRTVRFGNTSRNDLIVPFSNVPSSISLFRLNAGRVCVLLEPRLNGFINTGSEFGSVSDFLSPEGAIERLAAIEDPLEVPLSSGARGVIEIGDFDILFKIERPKPESSPPFLMEGAKGSTFQPPATDTALEAASPFLGIAFSLMIFIPVMAWLTTSPQRTITAFSDLPSEFVVDFIHPDHFRYLPKIYESEYKSEIAPEQAIEWVTALQQRWHHENHGSPSHSDIPILKNFYRLESDSEILSRWEAASEESVKARRAVEQDPSRARFYEFATGFPDIVTETSGGLDGSLYLQQLQRIGRLDKTYSALANLIESEQQFVSEFYTERGLKREQSFDTPVRDRAEIAQIDPQFEREKAAYQSAEGWAQIAQSSPFFASHRLALQDHSNRPDDLRVSVIWLSPSSELYPKSLAAKSAHSAQPEDDLIRNAKYSLQILDIPPPPAPTPVINRRGVDLVVFDRREEVRGCYEDVLSRDPHLEGTLKMSWWIGVDGQSKNIRVVATSLNQPRLIRCMEKLILNWKFPKPQNGAVKVEYPFRFVVEK